MVENPTENVLSYEEATPFHNQDEIDLHAGNSNLASLADARKQRVADEIRRRQQAEASRIERQPAPVEGVKQIGDLMEFFRNDALGIGEPVTQAEIRGRAA